jgi:hypothetical protein
MRVDVDALGGADGKTCDLQEELLSPLLILDCGDTKLALVIATTPQLLVGVTDSRCSICVGLHASCTD